MRTTYSVKPFELHVFKHSCQACAEKMNQNVHKHLAKMLKHLNICILPRRNIPKIALVIVISTIDFEY